jgi:hypothetical protein
MWQGSGHEKALEGSPWSVLSGGAMIVALE